MKNIQVSTVHFEMLKTSAKRKGIKPEGLLEMLIQEEFNRKK